MVHTGAAYAKQKNRRQIWACTSSIGPGALNMVTAAATATVNRIPVPRRLVITSPAASLIRCRKEIETPSDYTVSAADAFKPVSRYWDRISRPERLIAAAHQAIRVLTDPAETGAVTLARLRTCRLRRTIIRIRCLRKRYVIDRRPPSAERLKRAAGRIATSKRPLIIAGGGVHYSDATTDLVAFAEAFGIPVAETQAGKVRFPGTTPEPGRHGRNGLVGGKSRRR